MISVVIYSLTLIMTLIFVSFYLIKRRVSSFRENVVMCLILNLALTILSSIVSSYCEQLHAVEGPVYVVQYISELSYFFLHAMLAPCYWIYIMSINRTTLSKTKKQYFLFLIPFFVAELLVFATPFANCLFGYDENGDYFRGNLEFVYYIVAAFYIILSIKEMRKCNASVSRKYRFIIWYFFSFIIVGVVIQAIVPGFQVELFFEVLALLGYMFSVEGEDGLLDANTRSFNRRAFVVENESLLNVKHEYYIIIIDILNIKLYKKLLGYHMMCDVVSLIVEGLYRIIGKGKIYRTTQSNYALIFHYSSRSEVEDICTAIEKFFSESLELDGIKLDFNVNIALISVPNDFSDAEMLLTVAETTIAPDTVGVKVFDVEALNHLVRFSAVEQALKEAINNDRFFINFQPIWGVKQQKVTSCEALVRLVDPKLGFIPPDEFIAVAEKSALISDVGLIVFEKVCQAMSTDAFKALNLEYVEINLSLQQLGVDGFAEKVKAIMDKYSISSNRINLEITESSSYGILENRLDEIDELSRMGFTFSLDDYGTGYSNLSFVAKMNFLNIKSDKSLLWDSKDNMNSRIILEDSINMIRKLNRNLIQEGVETKEQLDMVVAAGANYIQGYYYSKPLLMDDFIDYVNSVNR